MRDAFVGGRGLAKTRYLQGVLLILWCWCACAIACARDIHITILCTTDLHGHLLACRDYAGNTNVGGLFRCASAIAAIRRERPNVLCVDCGDLVQGAPENGITKGLLAVRAMNHLGYDAWVLGNHDFDWGIEALAKLHDEARVPILAANLAGDGMRTMLPRVQPWLLREFEGVRVVLVGVTTPGTPAWLPAEVRGGVVFEDSVNTLRRIVPAIRAARPDIWILLIHQGLPEFKDDHANQLLEITREFPEWDVILGGHTHKVVPGTRLGRSLYVQAGYFGNWLAQVDLTFDNVSRKVSSKSSTIIEIGTNWPEHSGLRDFLGRDLQRAERKLAQNIGWCDRKLTAAAPAIGMSDIQDLIARAVAWKTGADAVLVGCYGEGDLEQGAITIADVWRAIPYDNTIGLISLTPAELRTVMEEASAWSGSPHVQHLWGIYIAKGHPSRGDRVQPPMYWRNGTPVHGRQRLRIAASSYALASGGKRYPLLRTLSQRPEARLQMTGIDTRSAVIEYVRKQKRIGALTDSPQANNPTSAKNMPDERARAR